ncbi:hypothetical protein F5J12DRAFT_697228, partial [Pisolithus orientalis]|uniref:uncharacterized protein n=1 Tax=Pisolithus orientalis TaxID=936130 RepID=UPI00222559A3
ELRERGVHIPLMIQADISAYHVPVETPQLSFPQPSVLAFDTACLQHFNPELTVGSPTVCCGNHLAQKPFREQRFPAAQVSERAGSMVDPIYHNSGDLSDRPGYELNQVRSICKVQVRFFPFR